MATNKPNQRDTILKHLALSGGITSMEAFELYGITRLSAVIFSLRKKGYDISSTEVEGNNRFGEKVRFSCYKLEGNANKAYFDKKENK